MGSFISHTRLSPTQTNPGESGRPYGRTEFSASLTFVIHLLPFANSFLHVGI